MMDNSLSLNLQLEEGPRYPPAGATTEKSSSPGGPPGAATAGEQSSKELTEGYNKSILVGEIQPKILCVQCHHILREPVQSRCGHRYCRVCYTSLVESKPGVKCSACINEGDGEEEFASLTMSGIFPDHAIRKDMGNMQARCENPGCDWIGTFGNFLKHELACELQKKKCECNEMVFANKMKEHKATECLLRTITCLYCSMKIMAKDKADHESSCEYYPQICKGCHSKMPRNKMAAHIDPIKGDCMNRKCPFGCDTVSTPSHQNEAVADHLIALLGKVNTLGLNIEQGPNTSQGTNSDDLTLKVTDLESKITELGSQIQTLGQPSRNSEFSPQGGASARPGGNMSVAVLGEKQATVESLVAVLNRQLEKIIIEYNELEHQRRLQAETIETVQRTVTNLERSVAMKDIALAEQDLRLQVLEQTTFDGVLVWPISDFSRKRQDAISGRSLSIYSPPFYTSRSGYKMCCRIYLNGDGMGKGTHISLFFVVMRGPYDAILPWPFKQKVTMLMIDQTGKSNIIDAFRPDPTSTSFKRPVTDMNIASGCPLFCPLGKLEERNTGYVKDDTIFIKVIVDQSGL